MRMFTLFLVLVLSSAASAATNCITSADSTRCVAVSQSTAAGAVVSGDLAATQSEGGAVAVLEERDATAGPPPKRADQLEHSWQFDIAAGGTVSFRAIASRVDTGGDGDNFQFFWSSNGGQTWTSMFTVNQAALQTYSYTFPAVVEGAVAVRVLDTDRTAARKNHATLTVDLLEFTVTAGEPPPPPSSGGPRIVGYYTSWSVYVRDYFVANIPASKLTHINYAFANVNPDGTIALGDEFADINKSFGNEPGGSAFKGNFQQLQILKSQNPHLRTLISVGGWTWSNSFSDIFADAGKTQTFCASLLNFVETYGFDGADIDWEYPGVQGEGDNSVRPGADGANFVTGLQVCSGLFKPKGKLLTIASPCSPSVYDPVGSGGQMDLAGMAPYLDWINLMAYDFHGPWDSITGHHAQLFLNPGDPLAGDAAASRVTGAGCAAGHVANGVPREKVVLGVPFYGRAYTKVTQSSAGNPAILGLFQPYGAIPRGTWDRSGALDSEDLVRNYIPNGTRTLDTAAKVPVLTWTSKGALNFVSYEDRQSVCAKGTHVAGNGLGGFMLWELSADIENHPESLLNAMYCSLNPADSMCGGVCQ